MNLTDILSQAGGLQAIARELGVSESQAKSGATALLPAIVGGFKKQAQGAGGAAGLDSLLGQLGGAGLLDNVLAKAPTDVNRGNNVLGAIFGSKDVSREVAQRAAQSSGVDAQTLRKMLPMLAMAVTGLMARQGGGATPQASGGGLGGMLDGLLGGKASGALGALAGGAGGAGGLLKMLDGDGDGNPLDDILRAVGQNRR